MKISTTLQILKGILSFLAVVFVCTTSTAQTHFARANGDWDQTSVWSTTGTGGGSCGCVPGAGDNVLIDGFDVDIDAGTGDVTVADIKITNDQGTDVRLRVQGGVTFRVTNDFEIESTSGGNDAELLVEDASLMDVDGDFLADQDDGDDLFVESDDDATLNIDGNAIFDQDGGDDMLLTVNDNSGSNATITIDGNLTWEHDGGDDGHIRVDDANSDLNVGGFLSVSLNAGDNDDFLFNLDNGTVDITGDLLLTRTSDCDEIDMDMESCVLTCDDLIINSSGPEFTDGAVRFFIDGDSEVNCASFSSNFSGADDLYIRINISDVAPNSGELNVTGDMTIVRTSGDDIEIMVEQDDSELNVGGDFSLTSSGALSEEFEFYVDNDATVTIGGDCTINTSNGEDVAGNLYRIQLEGGGDNPTFSVGGDFSWTTTVDESDTDVDLAGGTFSVGGNCSFIQNAGGNDFDIFLEEDAVMTVGGDLTCTNNGGDDFEFSMGVNTASTASCTVDGHASFIQNNAGGTAVWTHEIYDDCRLTVGEDLTYTTNFTSSPFFLVDVQNTAEISAGGDCNLNAAGSGELEIRLQDNTFFRIGGDFVRAASPNRFGELDCSSGTPTVEFMGSSNTQLIAEDAGDGGDSFFYYNVEIDNSFGTSPQLSMEGLATVHGDLTMNDGVVLSSAAEPLVVDDDATTSNASDASHVEGYMRKVGNDAFTFPSGHDGFHAPLGITAPGSATDQFECRYFNDMPHDAGFDSSAHDPTFLYISKVEYWQLNRTNGASTPTVTLSWDDPRSGGVGNTALLLFAAWDGSNWDDLGSSSVTGTTTTGTLDNAVGITTYDGNPFTLATTDVINPLPVELISFTGFMDFDHVDLNWVTKSELNNDYFGVERSRDGMNWEEIERVEGAGSTGIEQQYATIDPAPYSGVSYYRLRQVDFDGDFEYSNSITVNKEIEVAIYPNPTNGLVYIQSKDFAENILLYNTVGQQIPIQTIEENSVWRLSTEELAKGTYFVHFVTQGGVVVEQLVVEK